MGYTRRNMKNKSPELALTPRVRRLEDWFVMFLLAVVGAEAAIIAGLTTAVIALIIVLID